MIFLRLSIWTYLQKEWIWFDDDDDDDDDELSLRNVQQRIALRPLSGVLTIANISTLRAGFEAENLSTCSVAHLELAE